MAHTAETATPRDMLQLISRTWSRRAQVKVGGVEERLRFDPAHDDFLERLLPFHDHPAYQRTPRELKKRILSCGWIAYNEKTVVIETEIVAPACNAMLRGQLPGVADPGSQRAITETLVDEAYHVHLAVVVTNVTREARALTPPIGDFALASLLRCELSACTSTLERSLAQLAVATVSELLISDYLAQLSSEESIQAVHRESVASHFRDELAHRSLFPELTERVLRQLGPEHVDTFAQQAARAALWFADVESDVWEGMLEYLRVPGARELVGDMRAVSAGRVRPGNYAKLIEFAEQVGMLERSACREAFASVGLTNG